MTSIKAILFDLDGTLLDTAPDFADVINRLLVEESRPEMSFAEIRAAVSHGSRGLIETGFSISSQAENFEPLRQRLLDHYAKCLTNKTCLFEGIEALLQKLHQNNIPWGIVTNKPELYTLPIVAGFNLDPAAIVCPDHVTHTKPHPESIELACQTIGCMPTESVVIGDHLRDIDAGKRAGAITIAAAYGYLGIDDQAETWGADYLVSHPQELLPLLETLL